MNRRTTLLLLLALTAVALVWGMNWVVMKAALRDMGPYEFAALRLWLAAAFLFACLAVLGRTMRVTNPLAVILAGLFQTGLTTALTMWALISGSAGKNAVLCYAMPFWVVLFAWPLLGERPAPRQWVAIGIAISGVLLMVGGGLTGTPSDFGALGSGMAWAMGIVLTKRMGSLKSTDPYAFCAWQTLIGAFGLTTLMLFFPGKATEWTPTLYLALAYNALLVYGLVWFLWFWVLQKMEAGLASLGTLAVPVVGVLSGMLFLGERPTPTDWVGMALVMVALGLTASVAARGGR